ncbi:hypothetical protein [Scytonema sp. PRP1]|uniref:hypothetical protein n=1 Tax=Scytonema sp. PRP1 TaxID=3120513 RepID=UPI002FD6B624
MVFPTTKFFQELYHLCPSCPGDCLLPNQEYRDKHCADAAGDGERITAVCAGRSQSRRSLSSA